MLSLAPSSKAQEDVVHVLSFHTVVDETVRKLGSCGHPFLIVFNGGCITSEEVTDLTDFGVIHVIKVSWTALWRHGVCCLDSECSQHSYYKDSHGGLHFAWFELTSRVLGIINISGLEQLVSNAVDINDLRGVLPLSQKLVLETLSFTGSFGNFYGTILTKDEKIWRKTKWISKESRN